MNGYFKPLRRKLGSVTLVFACVLMAGWVESVDNHHSVCFASGLQGFEVFDSIDGRITWGHINAADRQNLQFGWHQYALEPSQSVEWRWRWYEFGVGKILVGDARFAIGGSLFVPYWSIAIPLTLLSAWLLIGKQRPATQKTTADCTSEKVV